MGALELTLLGLGVAIAGTAVTLGAKMFKNLVGIVVDDMEVLAELQTGKWCIDPEVSGGAYLKYFDLKKGSENFVKSKDDFQQASEVICLNFAIKG